MNQELRYYYTGFGAGYLTVAFVVSGDRDSNERKVKFGIAYCNPKDRFSKRDIVKKVSKTSYNRETKQVTVLESTETVTLGGKSLARMKFEHNPVEMTVKVEKGTPIMRQVIDSITDYCYEHGPSWKNKVKHSVSRNGTHCLSIDGFTVRFADPTSPNLIELVSPYGVDYA
jgi:hypothetical protein